MNSQSRISGWRVENRQQSGWKGDLFSSPPDGIGQPLPGPFFKKVTFFSSGHLFLLLLITVLFASGCANGLFYYPNQKLYWTPSDSGLSYEDVTFTSRDGTRLNGWFVKSQGKARGTVIHFHGNAQNMTAYLRFVDWLPHQGYNLFVFDYRGYGQSEGSPGRKGIYEDSLAAVKYVVSRGDVDKERLFAIGQSLGGTNAVAVVATLKDVRFNAVVVDSTFYSYRSIAREKIGRIPVISLFKWPLSFLLVTNGYSSGSFIKEVSPVPVLIIHGTCDRVVPYHHGVELYESANEPKTMWTVKDGRHIDALTVHGDEYQKKILEFFEDPGQSLGNEKLSLQPPEHSG